MKKKVTSSDIAKLAHVSQSTVSRALDPSRAWRISPQKRAEILALSKDHGYAVPSAGRTGTPKTFKVGLLLGSMEADLSDCRFMIRRLCDNLQANGYTLTLIRVDFSSRDMARNVRRILKSSIADIYVIGSSLLSGQTVELLHRISHRVICFYTSNDYNSGKTRKFPPWLSSIRYDYENSFAEAVRQIPAGLLDEIIYFGTDREVSQERISLLRKCLRGKPGISGKLPHLLFGSERHASGSDGYRITARIVRENLERLKTRRLYWCEGRVFATALKDELEQSGLVCGRDFEIVSFKEYSILRRNYDIVDDDFCYLVINVDRFADRLCELILSLVDDPTPKHAVVPIHFEMSRSLAEHLSK